MPTRPALPPLLRATRLPIVAALICLLALSGCTLPNLDGVRALLTGAAPEAAVEGVSSEQPLDAAAAAAENEDTAVDLDDLLSAAPGSFREISAAALESEDRPGLILFRSTAAQPFAGQSVRSAGVPDAGGQLWAIAPDGSTAGRISPEDYGGALLPAPREGIPPRLLAYGFELDAPSFEVAPPPEECLDASPACGGFQFSFDGRYLAYLEGEDTCGRTLVVIERASGRVTRTFPQTRWAYFTHDSTLLLAHGACDSPRVRAGIYIPHTDTYAATGIDGEPYWNPAASAVLIQTHDLPGDHTALWGFHIETGRVFMWMDNPRFMEDAPTWADPDQFLFEHRKIRYDVSSRELVLEGPLQIVRMNAKTRSQSLMAYDPRYDYHLCVENGVPCQEWYGDWVQVKRTPFQPLLIPFDEEKGALVDHPTTRCALYGYDCAQPAELFALNWKTGEMIPWEEAGLPALPDRPTNPGPDLSAPPVYLDPDGDFSFYPGLDGHSLWRVPADGDPELWVEQGSSFVYLP